MNVLHNPQFDIKKTTAYYTKKDGVPIHYVCTTDLDESDKPFDIYYRDTPHPDHNNYYFGLYAEGDRMMICKADSVEKYNFGMISDDKEEWVYSQVTTIMSQQIPDLLMVEENILGVVVILIRCDIKYVK